MKRLSKVLLIPLAVALVVALGIFAIRPQSAHAATPHAIPAASGTCNSDSIDLFSEPNYGGYELCLNQARYEDVPLNLDTFTMYCFGRGCVNWGDGAASVKTNDTSGAWFMYDGEGLPQHFWGFNQAYPNLSDVGGVDFSYAIESIEIYS